LAAFFAFLDAFRASLKIDLDCRAVAFAAAAFLSVAAARCSARRALFVACCVATLISLGFIKSMNFFRSCFDSPDAGIEGEPDQPIGSPREITRNARQEARRFNFSVIWRALERDPVGAGYALLPACPRPEYKCGDDRHDRHRWPGRPVFERSLNATNGKAY